MGKSHVPIRSKLRLNLKQISTIYDQTNKTQKEKGKQNEETPRSKRKITWGYRSQTRSARNEVQSNWFSWPARRSLTPLWRWRVEEREMIRKCKKAEWGKDGAAELAIKKDIEDSWKKKSGNYCCMCLFSFLSLTIQLFSLLRLQFRGAREIKVGLGSLEWQWRTRKTEGQGEKKRIESRCIMEGIRWQWHRPFWALFCFFSLPLTIPPRDWKQLSLNFLGNEDRKDKFWQEPITQMVWSMNLKLLCKFLLRWTM